MGCPRINYKVAAGLAESGYADKIMLAHDSILQMLGDPWIYSEKDAEDLANWNWTHVFDEILPAFQKMGLDGKTTEKFVTDNPRAFFTYE